MILTIRFIFETFHIETVHINKLAEKMIAAIELSTTVTVVAFTDVG